MSTKSPISSGQGYYLYYQELLSEDPRSVFLELDNPTEYRVEKETIQGRATDLLVVEIPSETMDRIAIDWIKKRKLQDALGGPIGMELGSPDNPLE